MRNYINEHWNWIPLKARRLASYSCYAVFHDPKEGYTQMFPDNTKRNLGCKLLAKKRGKLHKIYLEYFIIFYYFTCFIKYTKCNLPKSSPIYQKEKYYRLLHAFGFLCV
jgi:hypothetical protein